MVNSSQINQKVLQKNDLQNHWERVCKKFQFSHGQGLYTSWVKPLEIESLDNGFVTLNSPTGFIKSWVSNNFSGVLEGYFKEEFPSFKGFAIELKSSNNFTKTEDHISGNANLIEGSSSTIKNSDYGFESKTDERITFKNFVSNDTNKFAMNASKSISDKESKNFGLFKSLYIYGNQGNGKTHLLQSIANQINSNKKDSRKAIYLSAEKFMYGFMKSLRERNIIDFKEYIRSADVLLIDDIQFICGKQNIQEEFLHSFNAITEAGNSIILSSDRPAEKLKDIDDRLKSRLCAGITADIKTPDYELRLKFLQERCSNLKINVSEEILEFIARQVVTSIREVEGILNKIIAQSSLSGIEISMENVVTWTGNILNLSVNNEVTIDQIKRAVCNSFNLRMNEIESKSKSRDISRPRQIAIYLCKKLTKKSLPDIGRNFGGRDHATVIHSVKTVENLLANDSDLEKNIAEIKSSLKG